MTHLYPKRSNNDKSVVLQNHCLEEIIDDFPNGLFGP
jgi:hypothetical protein